MNELLARLKIKNIRDFSIFIFYFLLFAYGLNLFGMDNIILSLICIFTLVRQFVCHKIRLHKGLIFVVGFSIFYFLFYTIYKGFSLTNIFYFLFFPISLYLVGGSLGVSKNNEENEKKIIKIIFTIALGFVTRAFLGFLLTIKEFGIFQTGRYFLDIWNYGHSFTAATGVNFFVILISCLSLPIIFCRKEYRKFTYILISCFSLIFSVYLICILQNRSSLLIIGLSIIIYPLLQMFSNIKKHLKKFFILLVFFILLMITFLILYSNIESFRKLCNSIPIINRLFVANDESYTERIKLYQVFFDNFLKCPFGNMGIDGKIMDENGNILSSYFHNTWLDIYKIGGFLPFTFFILLTVHIIKCTIDFCIFSRNHFHKNIFVYALFGILSLFFFEPVMDANIYFFVLIFLFYGIIERLKNNYLYEYINYSIYSKIDKENYKIVFISNFLSIHQFETHYALVNKYGERYHFISLEPTMIEHQTYNLEHSKVLSNEIKRYLSKEQEEIADSLMEEADVIIYGSVPDKILKKARKKNKVILQCSERLFKKSKYEEWSPRAILSNLIHKVPYRKYQQFCLTYSSYTAYDYELINYSVNKCLNWGYWVKDSTQDDFLELIKQKKDDEIKIIFVNRLIPFKHPEKIIMLAYFLKNNNIRFHLNIIGEGELKQNLIDMVVRYELGEYITFCGTMTNDKVKEMMEKSHIVISCSDKGEGWGACVNEAMISGCCVIASHTTGSAYTIIKHRDNGMIYNFDDDADLFEKTLYLCNNREEIFRMGKNAFDSIKKEYNPDLLVERLHMFIESLIDGKILYQEEGPLSIQKPKSEDDVKREILIQDRNWKISKLEDSNKPKKIKSSSESNKFSKGAIISYFSIFLNIIAGLIYTPWMIKTLGQSNYGIYSLANSIVALIAVDLGLGTAVSRFISKYRAENDFAKANKMIGLIFKIFIILSIILLCFLTIIYFFLPSIYIELTSNEISTLRLVFIMIGLYSVVSFCFLPLNGILMGNDKFPQYKIITLVGRIINILLVAIVLMIYNNLFLYVFAIIASGCIELVIKLFYINKNCKYGSKPIFKSDHQNNNMLQTLLKFSFWAAISSLMSRLIISIQPSILGITSGTTQIAIFTLGATIEGYVWQIANGLDGMFIPKLSVMNENNSSNDEYTKLMINVGRFQLLFTGLIIVGFIVFGRSFISDVWKMSDDIFSYEESYFVGVLLLLPCLITFTQQIGNSLLIVKNKIKYRGISISITAFISVLFSLLFTILFKNSDAIWSALAICIGKFIGMIVCMNIFYKKILGLNIKYFFKECHLKIIPVFLVMLILGVMLNLFISSDSLIIFLLKILIFIFLYFVIVYKFILQNSEKKFIINLIDKIISFIKLTEK